MRSSLDEATTHQSIALSQSPISSKANITLQIFPHDDVEPISLLVGAEILDSFKEQSQACSRLTKRYLGNVSQRSYKNSTFQLASNKIGPLGSNLYSAIHNRTFVQKRISHCKNILSIDG